MDDVGRSSPLGRLATQLDVKVLSVNAPENSLGRILVDEDESADDSSVQLLHPVDQRGRQLLKALIARHVLGTVVHPPDAVLFH